MNTRDYLNGKSSDGYKFFGAHKRKKDDYIFRVLAPNAKNVSLIGDFNDWSKTPMRKYSTGVFSVSVNGAKAGDKYQYLIEDNEGNIHKKLDPYARKISLKEESSVLIEDSYKFKYKKQKTKPKNIYQVHLGSLFRSDKDKKEIYEDLIGHLKENNISHLRLMPISEYKNYKQLGYSPIGHFAISERYGDLHGFKALIDRLHKEKIGLIVELDLAEFDEDPIYLDRFDGTNLYNYDYDNIKYNYFDSINFDPSKKLVKSHLLSLVNYYTKDLNIDGIFFSSAENMVYWQGDKSRGVNEEFTSLIRDLNEEIRANKSFSIGGFNISFEDYDLGFDYIFDSEFKKMIEVFKRPPIERASYQKDIKDIIRNSSNDKLLGFSYVDSTVNEASLAMKMFGGIEKLSELKSLFLFLYSLKSQKTIFMGDERFNLRTFSIYDSFDFKNKTDEEEAFNSFYKDLSEIFIKTKALNDDKSDIRLLDIEGYSLYAYERSFKNETYLVIVNFTDIGYEIPAPYDLEEVINTNDLSYMGDGNVNGKIKKDELIRLSGYNSAIFKK